MRGEKVLLYYKIVMENQPNIFLKKWTLSLTIPQTLCGLLGNQAPVIGAAVGLLVTASRGMAFSAITKD